MEEVQKGGWQMKLTEYIDYFERLAAADPDLKHTDARKSFFCSSEQDATAVISSCENKYSMLLAPYDKRPKTNSSESHIWLKQGFFLVLGRVAPDDHLDQILVKEKCEEIADRMYKAAYYDRGAKLYGFDISSWDCRGVGPVVDNHYGYAVVFEIKDAIDLTTG